MLSASHLPKMDTFGSCDAFCELRFCGQSRRTAKVRNSYSPVWNARFRFQVPGPRFATALELDLFDWDLIRNEFIGRHVVPRNFMEGVARRPKGWKISFSCEMRSHDGEIVVGSDRGTATVTLALRVLESYSLQVAPESLPCARVEVRVFALYFISSVCVGLPLVCALWTVFCAIHRIEYVA